MRNKFEALCELAWREKWCWNLVCTTCGHCVFRWGLKALARGLHPDDPAWPVHWGPRSTSTELERINGPLHTGGGWPLAEQHAIQACVQGCELRTVVRAVGFPDWLGHFGVVLAYTEDAEAANHAVSDAVAPQLEAMVIPGSPAAIMLKQVQAGRPIRWDDLELVERDFARGAV